MLENESKPNQTGSEQIFGQIEQNLEAGGIRDLWLSLRNELAEGGPEAVRTYFESEYERRKAIVQASLDELKNQLEETT